MHGTAWRLVLAALFVCSLAVPITIRSYAAETWPQRPVRFILPLGPGSGVDIGARLFADRLSASWSQPVIVENKPEATDSWRSPRSLPPTMITYSYAPRHRSLRPIPIFTTACPISRTSCCQSPGRPILSLSSRCQLPSRSVHLPISLRLHGRNRARSTGQA
jgi:hypothetical protein